MSMLMCDFPVLTSMDNLQDMEIDIYMDMYMDMDMESA